MTPIGSTMMSEQAGPKQLVRDVALTEGAGEPMHATQLSLSFGTGRIRRPAAVPAGPGAGPPRPAADRAKEGER
jgi:hypothetical protein